MNKETRVFIWGLILLFIGYTGIVDVGITIGARGADNWILSLLLFAVSAFFINFGLKRVHSSLDDKTVPVDIDVIKKTAKFLKDLEGMEANKPMRKQICYKSNKECKHGCKGLCKESC